jgi:hypothetical protein
VAIRNTHNLRGTITEKLQNYTDLTGELKKISQLKTGYTVPLILSTVDVMPNGLYSTADTIRSGCYAKQIALKLLTFLPAVHILMQTAVILHTCRILREFWAEQGIRNA